MVTGPACVSLLGLVLCVSTSASYMESPRLRVEAMASAVSGVTSLAASATHTTSGRTASTPAQGRYLCRVIKVEHRLAPATTTASVSCLGCAFVMQKRPHRTAQKAAQRRIVVQHARVMDCVMAPQESASARTATEGLPAMGRVLCRLLGGLFAAATGCAIAIMSAAHAPQGMWAVIVGGPALEPPALYVAGMASANRTAHAHALGSTSLLGVSSRVPRMDWEQSVPVMGSVKRQPVSAYVREISRARAAVIVYAPSPARVMVAAIR